MVKIIAVLIIITAGASFGAVLSNDEKKELDEGEELLKLVSYVSRNIESRSAPLFEIFESYFSEENGAFSKKLRDMRGNYGEKLEKISKELFPKETNRELESFFKTLGKTDRETQIKFAINAKNSLEKSLMEKRKEYISKSKLYKILPILISCVAALLLY